MPESNPYDVIVVGGGGSGLAAAVSAAEHGLSALLLEKQPQLGGSTGIAVGSFTANQTSFQKRAGVDDSLDAHCEDAAQFARPETEARNNEAMRRFHLAHSNKTLEWLAGMGLAFHGPSPEPPNRVPRMHNVVPNAKAYIAVLQARFIRMGGEILCDAAAVELIKEGGRVAGVVADVKGERRSFKANRGVVLAAGDYASSPELIGQYKGQQYTKIEAINPNCHGDGHKLAESAGAPLINMDVTYGPELRFVPPSDEGFMQLLPSSGPLARVMGWLTPLVPKFVMTAMIKRLLVTWQHPEDSLLEDGAILINKNGERFCNEKVWPDREIAIADQPDKICYILLDQRLCELYSKWPKFISTAPEIAYAYVDDYLRLRPDVTVQSESLATIAGLRHMPVQALQSAVDAFNRYAAGNSEDPFGRTGDEHPLQGRRWVLLGPARANFTITEGSPAISERLEVLDANGQPIPGLYAVGQNGLGGQILWGHGLHIGWAMTSGRLVGEYLAEQEK
jgi:fumarate reductase flavoprotein subunit